MSSGVVGGNAAMTVSSWQPETETRCGDNEVPLGPECGKVAEPDDTKHLQGRVQVLQEERKVWTKAVRLDKN